MNEFYYAPCCGAKLESAPYSNIKPGIKYDGKIIESLSPPYESVLGEPSYNICKGCSFEFGTDDDYTNPEVNRSFKQYLLDTYLSKYAQSKWGFNDRKQELKQRMEEAGLIFPSDEEIYRANT